jgi:hypothetical protein
LEAVGRHVAIRASASVTAKSIDLTVDKSVKTAFNWSTLGAGTLAIKAGCGNRRLGDEQRRDGEMPNCDPFVHRNSSLKKRLVRRGMRRVSTDLA